MATFNQSISKVKNKLLYLKLNELVMGKMTTLFSQEKVAKWDDANGCFVFPRFEFTSDISKSKTPVPMKSFIIEIYEIEPKSNKHKFYGKT